MAELLRNITFSNKPIHMVLIVSLPVRLSLYLSLSHGRNISTLYIAAFHHKIYMYIHSGCTKSEVRDEMALL